MTNLRIAMSSSPLSKKIESRGRLNYTLDEHPT